MTFSYDEALDTKRDRVRFALGDIAETGHLLEDETINARLAVSTEAETVAFLAQGLAVRLSRKPDRVSIPGGPSVGYSRVQALTTAASTAAAGAAAGTNGARSLDPTRGDDVPPAEYLRPEGGEKWSHYDG